VANPWLEVAGDAEPLGSPHVDIEVMVFTTTKDELRGWIRALEWVIDKPQRRQASD